MKWFTSDWHLGHQDILIADERPFQSLFDMKIALSENINDKIYEDDVLYVIGDTSYKSNQQEQIGGFLDTLKVKRKILIVGNHDRLNWNRYIDYGFESVHSSLEVDDYVLVHDPAIASCYQEKKFICGHLHRSYRKCNNVVNVGCCAWDYKPLSANYIDSLFEIHGMRGLINVDK
jgi:calcineurin-like phosphoesterase family protein